MAQSSDTDDLTDDIMLEESPPPLPIEVLIHVMSYLSVSDRLAARLVSRTWKEASLAPVFLDKEHISIGQYPCNTNRVLDMLCNSTRPFYHLTFNQKELARYFPIWDKHGPCLRSLTLSGCDVSEKAVVEILKCCSSLRTLRFDNCQNFLISGRFLEDENDIKELSMKFQHLHELKLTFNRFLSDMLFNRLIAICPNLDSLCMMGCQISFHPGLYKKFYPQNGDSAPKGSKSVLTFMNMLRYLEKQAHRLKCLDLSLTLIDADALKSLCALEQLKLETLLLGNCQQLSLAGIKSLAQHQNCLKVLDLTGCVRITDASLVCICKSLQNLEVLKVEGCRAITDIGAQHIRRLQGLKHLNISGCELLTGKCITRGICWDARLDIQDNVLENDDVEENFQNDIQDPEDNSIAGKMMINDNMETLSAYSVNLSEESIEYMCVCFRNLTSLNLSFCTDAVTDKTIQVVFKELVHLERLVLFGCHRISDAGLTGITMNNSSNTKTTQIDNAAEQVGPRLRISLRSKAEEEIIRDAARKREVLKIREEISKSSDLNMPPGYSIMRLKNLRELVLSRCRMITDVSLKLAFAFPELRVVNLSMCNQITDVGLDYLSRNNSAIEKLNLLHCVRVSDVGISFIARRLHRLRSLRVMGCAELTDASLDSLYRYSKNLRHLDARKCAKMTSAAFERFDFLPIHVQRTKFVDELACEEIAPAPKPPAMPSHTFFNLS